MDPDTPRDRIFLPRVSKCCNKREYIGRYSSGGFVKVLCEGCGKLRTLSGVDFEKAVAELRLPCEGCGKTMQPNKNVDGYKNYGFRCACGRWMLLADIVPDLPR